MIAFILLFYFIINFITALELYIENPTIAIFNSTKYQPYYIDNLYFRESINNRFAINLKPGKYNISDGNYRLFDGQLSYGNPYQRNVLLKPNITTEISRAYSYNIENQYIYIFANIAKLSKKILEFTIYHNGKILNKIVDNKLDYLGIVSAEPGLNIITINALTDEYYCICPTIDNGYVHSYQLAIWNKTSINERSSVEIFNNIIDNLVIKLNESNHINMNYFNGLIK